MDAPLLAAAFLLGFAAKRVGLPPLVGYLVAGFVLHAFGYEVTEAIEVVSELGILLLLFGIGLKLRPKTLARPSVWASATVFAAVATGFVGALLLAIGALGIPLARDLDPATAVLVGFALSFSSTVFAVQALERTNESDSLAGRTAVGVLILQDIFAVAFLVLAEGKWPSPWAILVIPAFVLLRPVAGWFLDRSGHGEVLVLFGFTLAVGIGAGIFELLGMKADLGALAAGLLLSGHARSGEMADRLLGFKDLFLVGFFLSIGLAGTPTAAAWGIGLVIVLLLPAKTFGFLWLFTRFRLRARTSLHASLTLSTFSEFGLIVGAAALAEGLIDQAWVSTVAVAVAGSFVVASFADSHRYEFYDRWLTRLKGLERQTTLAEDSIVDFGDARVIVFGMGRVGTGSYDELVARRGPIAVGVDRSSDQVAMHQAEGRNVVRGDALDRDYWERVRFHPEVDLVIAAMSNHAANLECVHRVQEFLPDARIAAIARYPDQIAELCAAGVDVARNLYEEAGQALADDAAADALGPDE
jgi:glutathione-regulated potassium-efflux system ancillary protein KefC